MPQHTILLSTLQYAAHHLLYGERPDDLRGETGLSLVSVREAGMKSGRLLMEKAYPVLIIMNAALRSHLSELLTDLSWVEAKLHAYGVASVVQDYRRCGLG